MSRVAVKRDAPEQNDTAAAARRQQTDNEKAPKIPKVKHLLDAHGLPQSVPRAALKEVAMNKLLTCDRMIAIDVKTHDVVPKGSRPTWLLDQFGLRTRNTADAMSYLRIVKLGWADGSINETGDVMGVLVKPCGFASRRMLRSCMASPKRWRARKACR